GKFFGSPHQHWQQDFEDYTYYKPETYIRDLLKNLDILEDFIDKSVIKYDQSGSSSGCQFGCHKKQWDIVKKQQLRECSHKLVNETQMQIQEGKVDMGKAVDAGLVVTESSRTKSDKLQIRELCHTCHGCRYHTSK
nr:hypothetical protein [Tanacetum cinerariifolium]